MNYDHIIHIKSFYQSFHFQVVDNNLENVIILEDDAKFEVNFKSTLNHIMNQIDENSIEWDLLYLNRNILAPEMETWNYDVEFRHGFGLMNPSYSYSTVAYGLSVNGAIKLINSDVLKKILPVDEFLPLMFDRQPK